MDWYLFARSAVIGLSIAAPVGPIGTLCIRKTLAEGVLSGLACGLGAAVADAAYGWIAAQGLVTIAEPVMKHHMWLRIFAFSFLIYLAFNIARSKPQDNKRIIFTAQTAAKTFISTLFLTLTNPMTIFSFLAIFAALGIGIEASTASTGSSNTSSSSFAQTATAVSGVFVGSLLWWLVLTALVSKVRRFVGDSLMVKINYASAAIIVAFAIAVLFEAANK